MKQYSTTETEEILAFLEKKEKIRYTEIKKALLDLFKKEVKKYQKIAKILTSCNKVSILKDRKIIYLWNDDDVKAVILPSGEEDRMEGKAVMAIELPPHREEKKNNCPSWVLGMILIVIPDGKESRLWIDKKLVFTTEGKGKIQ